MLNLLTVDVAAMVYQYLSMKDQLTVVACLNRLGQRLVRYHPFLLNEVMLRTNSRNFVSLSWLRFVKDVLIMSGSRLQCLIVCFEPRYEFVPELIPSIVSSMQPRRLEKLILKGHLFTGFSLKDLHSALEKSESPIVEWIIDTCSCSMRKLIKIGNNRNCNPPFFRYPNAVEDLSFKCDRLRIQNQQDHHWLMRCGVCRELGCARCGFSKSPGCRFECFSCTMRAFTAKHH